MAIQAYICDRCGASIAADRSVLDAVAGPVRSAASSTGAGPTIDLCPACAAAFRAWLSRGPEAAAVKGVPDPPRRPATLKALRGARP
jgi:hypothetical protein